MRRLLYGSLTAATLAATVAITATASAADTPVAPVAPAVGTPSGAVPAPAGCTQVYTLAQHRGYARRVFRRTHIKRHALRRLHTLRHCQKRGTPARRIARRTERKLKRWRSLYHCTDAKVVNCIRDATRIYGGSFSHNVACARSESGLNAYARNRSGAAGLFQFMPSTFASTLRRMNVRGKSIHSAKWNSRAAAWKFVHDGYGEWSGPGC